MSLSRQESLESKNDTRNNFNTHLEPHLDHTTTVDHLTETQRSRDDGQHGPHAPRLSRSRNASHSLLPTATETSTVTRKGRSTDADTTVGNVERASISMPPPTARPSSIYRPSASRGPSGSTSGDPKHVRDQLPGDERLQKALDTTAVLDDLERVPSDGRPPTESLLPPESNIRTSRSVVSDIDSKRLSFSSFYSLGSAIYSGGMSGSPSATSSNAGSVRSTTVDLPTTKPGFISPPLGASGGDASASATTATDPVSVTAGSHTSNAAALSPPRQPLQNSSNIASKHLESWNPPAPKPPNLSRRSRSRTQRRPSRSLASSTSPNNVDRARRTPIGKIGVCALDIKARSKPSRNILTRLQNNGEFEVIVFGDKAILDEAVENWPICDFLISFFSDGFPLNKAIAYAQLRKPFCINDLPLQKVLWDRRICLRILDCMGVPTPQRLEVNRDGGPTLESADMARHLSHMSGVRLEGPPEGTGGGILPPRKVSMTNDQDTLIVDGVSLKKPFVEKPTSGEDHNIRIYFPKSHDGGGGRRLFRKIGNKSSEWDSSLIVPRAVTEEGSSYVYEQFLHVDNAEDVKAYTVGPDFCHAETRKSPVVDGLVRRNTNGKEIRYITSLTKEEALMAAKIAQGFGQRICGFDLLRAGNRSFVIDVNGWSFVKDNNEYYDKCASILRQMFIEARNSRDGMTLDVDKSVEGSTDITAAQSKPTSTHRSTLKSILKSPSLSRLAGSHHGQRTHGTASPDVPSTPPLPSPPSFDRHSGSSVPTLSIAQGEMLPPPAVSGTDALDIHPQSSAERLQQPVAPLPASKHSWKLKGMVSVIRHADRTPKQKFKFTFHTQPFVDLLKGHQEEVLLKGEAALGSVLDAVKVAMQQGVEDMEKLLLLRTSLARKGAWAGTKVQIKPMFRKRSTVEPSSISPIENQINVTDREKEESSEIARMHSKETGVTLSRFSAAENDLILDKLQLIIKWGGEPTHSARYQSQDLGENMRNDLLLMNREALDDVRVYSSSERRVSTSAQIWASAFLRQKEIPDDFITVRKDLLDDSNAAKDVMDKVKKKLKLLLREGHEAPPQFAWPANMPEPSVVVRRVAELMRFHRRVMRHNYNKFGSSAAASLSALSQSGDGPPSPGGARALAQAQAVASVQARWCCGEDAELFKERWEKLFSEFCDSVKLDPSKLSELYDSLKFDALHNRQFLEWVFTPSANILEEEAALDADTAGNESSIHGDAKSQPDASGSKGNHLGEKLAEKGSGNNLAQKMGFRKKAGIDILPVAQEEPEESYFKLFGGNSHSKAKQDARLENLRELYKLAKVLFDFVCPQEYGIDDSEKLEIGLLTSLPLLKEIVKDLEEVQASEDAKSFIYFTKESHMYTLLNCLIEGGIKTKIARNAIPELDYLSQICFELYEAEDKDADSFTYSIRIGITPGCHTFDPLDVQLDSKHSIGCAPRRSLTAHGDWKEVIEMLRAKFHTVKLPKSFIAINLSDKHGQDSASDDT